MVSGDLAKGLQVSTRVNRRPLETLETYSLYFMRVCKQ